MTYDTLLEQLSDPSAEVRETVCWALGQLGYREAGRRLARVLKADPCELVRAAAADALAKIRDPSAVVSLTLALEDPDFVVRLMAVMALASLRDARAVDALKRALDQDENAPIRDQILDALRLITGQTHQYLSAEERKIAKYLKEVQAHPESGPAHYNLAVAYFHHKQYALAQEHCELARGFGMGVGWLRRRLDEVPAGGSAPDQRRSSGPDGSPDDDDLGPDADVDLDELDPDDEPDKG